MRRVFVVAHICSSIHESESRIHVAGHVARLVVCWSTYWCAVLYAMLYANGDVVLLPSMCYLLLGPMHCTADWIEERYTYSYQLHVAFRSMHLLRSLRHCLPHDRQLLHSLPSRSGIQGCP